MPPPVQETLLTDDAGIEQVFGRCGVMARLDVDRTNRLNVGEEAVRTYAKCYGTGVVYDFLGGRYSLAELSLHWPTYWWTSVIAAHNLAVFRCGSIPASLQAEYETTVNMLKLVQSGQLRLASIVGTSGTGVSIDNQRMDPRYAIKQMRVVDALSDGPPQQSPRREDIRARYAALYERDQ
jgi:hypothetical protein